MAWGQAPATDGNNTRLLLVRKSETLVLPARRAGASGKESRHSSGGHSVRDEEAAGRREGMPPFSPAPRNLTQNRPLSDLR